MTLSNLISDLASSLYIARKSGKLSAIYVGSVGTLLQELRWMEEYGAEAYDRQQLIAEAKNKLIVLQEYVNA